MAAECGYLLVGGNVHQADVAVARQRQKFAVGTISEIENLWLFRCRGSGIDPRAYCFDLLRGELSAIHGHSWHRFAGDQKIEAALGALSEDNQISMRAALLEAVIGLQVQAAHFYGRRV